MRANKWIVLPLLLQTGVVSAEIVKLKNGVPFREIYNLTDSIAIEIKTKNGKIDLLPSSDDRFTIEAVADHFVNDAEVELMAPTDGKFKFELQESRDSSAGGSSRRVNKFINGVNVNTGVYIDSMSSSGPVTFDFSRDSKGHGGGKKGIFINGKSTNGNVVYIDSISSSGSGPVISMNDDGIFINGTITNGGSKTQVYRSPKLDITLHIPPKFLSHTQLVTSNERITVEGFADPVVERRMRFTTSNGGISLNGVATRGSEHIEAKTTNAGITASNCKGKLVLETTGGGVTASNNADGDIRISTSRSSVKATGNSNGDLSINTSNTQVTVTDHSKGGVSASTSNASIHFNNPKATFERGSTSNAKVHYTP